MTDTTTAAAPDSLALPTAILMGEGGDDRITLDEQSGLNSYGCAPEPVRAISYSSSTASSVSSAAYAHAHTVHHRLRQAVTAGQSAPAAYAAFLERARTRIRTGYGLADDVAIAFGPSGTDLEYLALALALGDADAVTNIVVEVDEVGSGCLYSQAGQYFAANTALGKAATKGAPLAGFDAGRVSVVTLNTRSAAGPVEAEEAYCAALVDACAAALADGRRPLVHVVHRSKTGIVMPSLATLDTLLARFGDAIDLVVDACQGRIAPATIDAYLARGASVFVTGSKFIGGPPFSAFALVPARLADRMTGGAAPLAAGLGDFFARAELPPGWTAADGVLPDQANFGLLLRLEAGLFELERLLALPILRVDAVISAFAATMCALPADFPFRTVEGDEGGDLDGAMSHPLDRKMLYVVELVRPHPSRSGALTIDEARDVYRFLFTDHSGDYADVADSLIAAEICHLGQPVKCLRAPDGQWAPTLRLSLSAPQIFDMIGLDAPGLVDRFTADVERIAAKMNLAIAAL